MRELELKFALPLSLENRLEADAGSQRREQLWSCYYDTPDGRLARARAAVRVRRQGDRWLQTVKAEGAEPFERFEWERPVAGPAPELDALPPESHPAGAVTRRSFGLWRPLFETDFERASRRIEPRPGLQVEIARDVGEVRCGERREPFREVELECLQGSRAAFFDWAHGWAAAQRACLSFATKNERGLRLAARLPIAPAAVKARAATPSAEAPVGQALADVVRSCIAHACANIEPILATEAPEGPHQLRVAMRRLRAAIRLFDLRDDADGPWQALDRDASALADAAGDVREFDVLEAGLLRDLQARFAGDAAIETLARTVVEARDAARMTLRRTVAGPATTELVLRALAMAETAPVPDGPFGAFVAERLRALHRRVRRRAQAARDEPGWHRTRIAVKVLRYSLEFAAEAVPRGVDVRAALALLADWQETLGAGQDLAVARDVAAAALARPGVPAEAAIRATGVIDGWLAAAGPAHAAHGRGARRALRLLRDAMGPLGQRAPAARPATARDTADADAGADTEVEAKPAAPADASDASPPAPAAAAGPAPPPPRAGSGAKPAARSLPKARGASKARRAPP
jgi:inorganic triphosphatase YgiF